MNLKDAGIDFIAADLPEANRLTIGIMALVAEQEREAISKRAKEALAAAKVRGVQLGAYRDGNFVGRVGTSKDTKKASEISDKLKVVAMQVSAMKPMGLNEESLDPKVLEDEKDIILKQIENTPDDKKEQIIKGKLNKFIKENTLIGQALITDPKNTVSNYVSDLSKSNNLDLNISSMDLYTI